MLIVQPSPIASVVQRVVEIEGPRRALGAPEIGDEVFGSGVVGEGAGSECREWEGG